MRSIVVAIGRQNLINLCRRGPLVRPRHLPSRRIYAPYTTSVDPQPPPAQRAQSQPAAPPSTTAKKSHPRKMSALHKAPLVWIDCEMTGLDQKEDEIIEIFCLVTNGDLELLDKEGWGTVVHVPKERMDKMDEWCTKTHGETGLTAAVLESDVTPEQAADGLLEYLKKHVPEPRQAILAGNSVHFDRIFLSREPYRKVIDFLYYRILDVSSLKEATRRWCPAALDEMPPKKLLHKARDDILESIEEARFYKDAIFGRIKADMERASAQASASDALLPSQPAEAAGREDSPSHTPGAPSLTQPP